MKKGQLFELWNEKWNRYFV